MIKYPWCILLLLAAGLSATVGVMAAQWVTYQEGSDLKLAIDSDTLWLEKDGLIHFVHQETFRKPQYDKGYRLHYFIRQTTGYADCSNNRYVFVKTQYLDQNSKHLFSTMFPVPRYNWAWQPVYASSVASAMMAPICQAATITETH